MMPFLDPVSLLAILGVQLMDPTVCCANREASPLNRKFSKSHVKFLLIERLVSDRCLSSVSARQALLLHAFSSEQRGLKTSLLTFRIPRLSGGVPVPSCKIISGKG